MRLGFKNKNYPLTFFLIYRNLYSNPWIISVAARKIVKNICNFENERFANELRVFFRTHTHTVKSMLLLKRVFKYIPQKLSILTILN